MAFPPALVTTDGVTVLSKAFFDAYNAEMLSALKDASVQTPAQTTTEVRNARGGFSTLVERLNLLNDSSGNPLSQVSPQMIRNDYARGNAVFNGGHLSWSRGVAAAPDGWTLSGTGAAVAQCGSGQGDTNVLAPADTKNYSAKLTYGSATARLTQKFAPAGDVINSLYADIYNAERFPVDGNGNAISGYGNVSEMPSIYVLAAVLCSGTDRARISVGDQAGAGSGIVYSEYHPGGNAWRWLLAGPCDVDQIAPATLNIQAHVESAGTGYFMHWMIAFGRVGLPPTFIPERPIRRSVSFQTANNPSSATGLFYWSPDKPALIMGARLGCSAAPTVGACTVDLLTPVGGAYVSMFATLPDIAATKFSGIQACDPSAANYRRRCIRGIQTDADAALADNSIMRVDYVDDAGGTTRDLVITVDYLEFPRPFEQWRTQTDLGE